VNSFLRQYAAIALTRHVEEGARPDGGQHHAPYSGRRRDRNRAPR